jgi:gluconokinase
MPQTYVIGIDIGTSSTRSVLFNLKGQEINRSAITYPLHTPTPQTAEQEPEKIYAAVMQTVRQVMQTSGINPPDLLCLSFSVAMHSLMAIDADGNSLTKVLTWADNRSMNWANKLRDSEAGDRLYQQTGVPIHPMSPLAKIIWLREEYPEVFDKTTKFISIKEYILYRWFHRFIVDHAIASATGLLNLQTLNWDKMALAIAGITSAHLSQLVPITQILQPLPGAITEALGVLPDTPVVIGASDGVLANIGLGALAPDQAAITIGTSGAVRVIVDRPLIDPQQRLFCYAFTPDRWLVGGAANNGGVILQWLRDQLALASTYDDLINLAKTVPAGAEGLLFHPYLLGERSPLWQPEARGSFFGLTINHTKAHLVRAVLEGIGLNLYLIFEALQDLDGSIDTLKAAGGFAASSIWRQIITDIFDREMIIPEQHESSSLGAAIVGLYALQQIEALDDNPMLSKAGQHYQPIPANSQIYQQMKPIYQQLLIRFQEEYKLMSHLQNVGK